MSVSVSAVIPSAGNCRFRNAPTTLGFGLLDPGNPANVTVDATIGFRCNGGPLNVVFAISSDDGRYESGPGSPRMRHNSQPTEFLPYSLALNPASGTVPRNRDQLLNVTGTVLGASYVSAAVGAYSDTVTLSILP
jgi:spore coat protein U-like protein